MQPFFLNHINKCVSKNKSGEKHTFLCKIFYDTASLRSAHGLYKPIAYIYEKNIFIFVSHTNKTVSKNKDAEKYIISP
jgi:hypothetical protein